jgi:hypothetical protein
MVEPLRPPPQLVQASAKASAPVAASKFLQETFMFLLSQQIGATACNVRS